jgi:hypothetical protein
MRASYPQHGGRAAALMFIESCKRAIIDHIPKIKDWVFNSEDFKRGNSVIRRAAVFRGQQAYQCEVQGCSTTKEQGAEMGSIKIAFDLTGKTALVTGGSRGLVPTFLRA